MNVQLLALPVGVENIAIPSEEARARMRQALTASPSSDDGRRQWKRGELEYEALMRQLDSAVSKCLVVKCSSYSW